MSRFDTFGSKMRCQKKEPQELALHLRGLANERNEQLAVRGVREQVHRLRYQAACEKPPGYHVAVGAACALTCANAGRNGAPQSASVSGPHSIIALSIRLPPLTVTTSKSDVPLVNHVVVGTVWLPV